MKNVFTPLQALENPVLTLFTRLAPHCTALFTAVLNDSKTLVTHSCMACTASSPLKPRASANALTKGSITFASNHDPISPRAPSNPSRNPCQVMSAVPPKCPYNHSPRAPSASSNIPENRPTSAPARPPSREAASLNSPAQSIFMINCTMSLPTCVQSVDVSTSISLDTKVLIICPAASIRTSKFCTMVSTKAPRIEIPASITPGKTSETIPGISCTSCGPNSLTSLTTPRRAVLATGIILPAVFVTDSRNASIAPDTVASPLAIAVRRLSHDAFVLAKDP